MRLHLPIAVVLMAAACGPSQDSNLPSHPKVLEQWTNRAAASYRAGDFDDARDAVARALSVSANDPTAHLLGAKVALAELDYAEALRLSEGVDTTDAHALRGRARWYAGDLEAAADELDAELRDPELKDPWAREVIKLARAGSGRHPFQMDGATIAVSPLQNISPDQGGFVAADVIRCEVEGTAIFALIGTGVGEVLVDSSGSHEPSWVNLRFGGLIEVKDVPALPADLSAYSREIGIPIHMVIGSNLLRHLHTTFDRRGGQFIVRNEDPLAPPEASRVPLYYVRGGAMVLRARVAKAEGAFIPMFVDTSRHFPLSVSDVGWKLAGVDPTSLVPLSESPPLRRGLLPMFTIGGFELGQQSALEGMDLRELQAASDVDLGGVIGEDLLAYFRITIANDGRFAWLEGDSTAVAAPRAQQSEPLPSQEARLPVTAPRPSPSPQTAAPPVQSGGAHK